MAWIEDEHGHVLLVKQRAGLKLWALPGGKVRAREALGDALVREIREETGRKVRSAIPCGFYDRHEKSNLTVLFRVVLREGKAAAISTPEIETVEFRGSLPRNSTPSLRFFWTRMQKGH